MRQKISVYIPALFLNLILLLGLSNYAQAINTSDATSYHDAIVVTVNDGVITERELDKRFQMIKQNANQAREQSLSDQTLRNQVLEQMIIEKLQRQQADVLGIKIRQQETEQILQNIAASRGLSLDQLQQRITAEGLDWNNFQNDIKDEIKINHLRQQEIEQKTFISDNEIEEYLAQLNQSNVPTEAYDFEELTIENLQPNNAASRLQVQKKANELLHQAIKNKDFSNLIKKNAALKDIQISSRRFATQSYADLPENYQKALASLSNGEIANVVIESGQNFVLLHLIDKKNVVMNSTREEFHVSHILRRISNTESEAQALNTLAEVKRRLDGGAHFADLAKTYSEDPGSAARGGELGWVRFGQMVPEFEQALSTLPLQKISEPVRTSFGYHLILVDQKRSIKETVAERNAEIRQLLAHRKAETKYLEWLAQLRDSAYIHYASPSRPILSR